MIPLHFARDKVKLGRLSRFFECCGKKRVDESAFVLSHSSARKSESGWFEDRVMRSGSQRPE